jgi:purine catabolism regulator
MATFGELWTTILPAALPLAPIDDARLGREIAWVRVLKARVPAFDALEAGDVAIVPAAALAVVAPGTEETATLIDALAAAAVAGILVVDSEEGATAVEALGSAAVVAGLPVLRVPRTDPNQLERSVIGFLVNRRAEVEHQAGLLEATLEEVALGAGAGDASALIATAAGFLGRALALEGRRGEVLAVHAPEQAPGAAAAVSAYLAGSRVAALRIPLPAPAASGASDEEGGAAARTSAGRLALLGDRPVGELERVVGARVGRLLALELARADAVRRAQDTARRGESLPAEGPPWVMLMARQVPRDGAGASVEGREEMRARIRALAPARRLAMRGDAQSIELRLVLAARGEGATGVGSDMLALAARIASLLARPVALSRPFVDPAGRPAAEAEARATLEAIEGLPDPPAVARGDRLAAYRLLGSLANLADGPRTARTLLEPLLVGSQDARRERLATLRAVLEQPGFNEAAAALGVHRNTLAYRIRRIEQLTGWRLADPELRLPLAIAARLVQSD